MWKWKSLSHVRLFAIPWTIQSMEFSRPEDCSGSHSPGDCPNPGMEPRSPALQAGSLPAESLRRQTASYLCVLKIHFLPLAAFKISLFFFFFVFSCLIMIIYTCRILWYFSCLRFMLLLESMDWCSSSVLENSKRLFLQILLLPYSLSPDFLEI